jgi:hypothetical protein
MASEPPIAEREQRRGTQRRGKKKKNRFYIGFTKLLFTVTSSSWIFPLILTCEIYNLVSIFGGEWGCFFFYCKGKCGNT